MLEFILKIEFLLNLSKQTQKYRSKQVQNLVEEGGRGVTSIFYSIVDYAYSYYVLTKYIYQYDVMSCSEIMWNLFTKCYLNAKLSEIHLCKSCEKKSS